MKEDNITETAVLAIMPLMLHISDISPWLTAIASAVTILWFGLQSYYKIKRENRAAKERKQQREGQLERLSEKEAVNLLIEIFTKAERKKMLDRLRDQLLKEDE